MRTLLRLVDGVTVLTHEVRCGVLRLAPNLAISLRAHPVYDTYGPSVSTLEARTTLGLPTDAPVVLFFGHIKAYKGLDLLLDAFSDVHARTQAHLVVAGAMHPSGRMQNEALIAMTSSVDCVTYRSGLAPDSDVPSLFCAADVVALPYRRPASSGVLQIAAYYARPVVAPRFDAFEETVREAETGILFEAGDSQDLTNALVQALDLPSNRVVQAFEAYRSEASWSAFADQWLAFVQSHISSRSNRPAT